MNAPMYFAIGFIFTFIHGGITGLFLGNVVIDLPLSDSYFVVAHFHMVMGVSPVLVVFAAIYHWYPKISGRMYHEGVAKLHFWCTFLGTYFIYLPMHYLGFLGVPRRYYALGTTDREQIKHFAVIFAGTKWKIIPNKLLPPNYRNKGVCVREF